MSSPSRRRICSIERTESRADPPASAPPKSTGYILGFRSDFSLIFHHGPRKLLSGQFHFDDRRINISVAQRADTQNSSSAAAVLYESSIYTHHCVYVLVRAIWGCPRGGYSINHLHIEINQTAREFQRDEF